MELASVDCREESDGLAAAAFCDPSTEARLAKALEDFVREEPMAPVAALVGETAEPVGALAPVVPEPVPEVTPARESRSLRIWRSCCKLFRFVS